jgi:alpha-tubulin suppressor-like RCC1 family protein
LGGTLARTTDTNGLAAFNDLSVSGAGVYQLQAAVGPATAASSVFTVPITTAAGQVVAWGYDSGGQTEVPAGLTNVVAADGGAYHSLVLESNGVVVIWGDNTFGQGGVPASVAGCASVAAGWFHNLAVQSNSTVVAWGNNISGQTNVPAGLTNVTAVAGGWLHSLALRTNGTVIAWGNDSWGQTNVPAGLTNVTAIAAGELHSLALLRNGTVVAWGDDTYGQTNVPAGLAGVATIAAGQFHCLAVQSNGTVVAWGDNTYGQTNVPAGSSKAAVAGAALNLALGTNGIVTAWGNDFFGQTNVPAGLAGVMSVGAGAYHSLAVLNNADGLAAGTNIYWRAKNTSLKIAVADLLTNVSNPNGGTLTLAGINLTTTNGVLLATNSSYVFYANPNNVTDAFTYTVSDGSVVSTGTGLIQIVQETGNGSAAQLLVGFPGAGTNTIYFAGYPGYQYIVQFATRVTGPWVNLSTNTAASDGLWQVEDDNATNSSRFYRVIW